MTMLGFTLVESCLLQQQSAQVTNDAELTFVQQIVVAGRYAIRRKSCTIRVCGQSYNQIMGSLYETRKCYRDLATNVYLLSHYIPDYAHMSCTATQLVGHAINETHALQDYSAVSLFCIHVILPRDAGRFRCHINRKID